MGLIYSNHWAIPTRIIPVFTLFTNRMRPRSMDQSRNNQIRRQRHINRINRIYRRRRVRLNEPINNEDVLNRIANLPQQTANDPFTNQFFNGSPFIFFIVIVIYLKVFRKNIGKLY